MSWRVCRRLGGLAAAAALGGAGLHLGPVRPVEAGSYNWIELRPAKSPPPTRLGAMAYDPATQQLILFGGEQSEADGNYVYSNSTWSWNGSTWTELSPSASPSAREGAAMAYDASTKELLLFGGYNPDDNELNDTWEWTGKDWTALSPAESPSPRVGAAMAYDTETSQLLLFGGFGESGLYDNDTWVWAGTSWDPLSPASAPDARYDVAMAYDTHSRQLILFGGYDGGGSLGALDDTWSWSGSDWEPLSPAAWPPARYSACVAYDPATADIVLFGGTNFDDWLSDTWTWTGSDWEPAKPAKVPTARDDASCALAGSQFVMFGGQGEATLFDDDTWTYGGAVPSAPKDLTATGEDAKVDLSWKAPASQGGSAITGYDVFDSTKSGEEGTKPINSTPLSSGARSFTKTGLAKGVRIYFVVKAVNAAGLGAASNQVSAVPT